MLGILGIGFLIAFHEFGHFIFGKLFNVEIPTFSIGMGPRIFSKKIGETEFILSAIPLGGYVEIMGEGQQDASTTSTPNPRLFSSKPYYQQMIIISGGIICNLLFAYFVLSALFFAGMPQFPFIYPKYATSTIKTVHQDSPAQKGGLLEGDTLLSINGKKIKNNPTQVINYLKDKQNQSVKVTVERNNHEQVLNLTIGERTIQKKAYGYLGLDFDIPRYGLFDSIKFGVRTTNEIICQTFQAFKSIFTKRSVENIGGPIMMISETIKSVSKGFKIFLLILAVISINLAVLNVIPLPILDGGQALFYTIEAIIRRPLPEQIKLYIHYACWFGIMALALFLSVKDILRMFIQ